MADSRPNFDHIARPYRWLEYLSFGPNLERCRFQFLGDLGPYRRALVLGDGDGRFTARLLACNHEIRIDAVDSSAAMLRLLRRQVSLVGESASKRLRTDHSDALTLDLHTNRYDLVVTHFFLDCFTADELTKLFERITPHLDPDAVWLVSEFAIPKRQPASTFSRLLLWALYRAFRVLTGLQTQQLPDYAERLRANGFSVRHQNTLLQGLLVSELWFPLPGRNRSAESNRAPTGALP